MSKYRPIFNFVVPIQKLTYLKTPRPSRVKSNNTSKSCALRILLYLDRHLVLLLLGITFFWRPSKTDITPPSELRVLICKPLCHLLAVQTQSIAETLDLNHKLKGLVALEQGWRPMARVPEVARGIHWLLNIFYLFWPTSVPVLWRMCVCTSIYVYVYIYIFK